MARPLLDPIAMASMTMKTTISTFALFSLAVNACGGATPPTAPTSGKTTIAPPVDEPLPGGSEPASVDPRFPAGRGTTLVIDQLVDLQKDAVVRDMKAPLATRIAKAREMVGEQGETLPDGSLAFRAVSPRNFLGPFGCSEYILSEKKPAALRPADYRHCGLPYAEDPTTATPSSVGARHTIVKLKEVLAILGGLGPQEAKDKAKSKLFMADQGDGDDLVWLGIGPRDDEAPITCHGLKAGSSTKPPRIEKLPLAACSIAWPPPRERFERGPDIPPTAITPVVEGCVSRCGSKEICVVERISGQNVSIVMDDPDTVRGRYPDGRPAPVKLNTSCATIPSSCNPVTTSCFFTQVAYTPGVPPPPRDPGPCKPDTYMGHSFTKTKSGSPYIMCFERDKPMTPSTAPTPQVSRVALKIGASKSFSLDDVASYTVGTTQIVELSTSKNALVVQAKKQGSATLVLVDKQGARTSVVIDVK